MSHTCYIVCRGYRPKLDRRLAASNIRDGARMEYEWMFLGSCLDIAWIMYGSWWDLALTCVLLGCWLDLDWIMFEFCSMAYILNIWSP